MGIPTAESGPGRLVEAALARRRDWMAEREAEGTDCFRLFHGHAEGRPGLTVDRYGPVILAQTFREPLTESEWDELAEVLGPTAVYRARAGTVPWWGTREWPNPRVKARELGLEYWIQLLHRGLDPQLFLDFRSVRRYLQANSQGHSVLNLFAYTGSAGLCAVRGGASRVVQVDVSVRTLQWARENAFLNQIDCEFWAEDVFPILWQLAGGAVKGRARRRTYMRVKPEQFSIIVLDPPTLARGPYGAVDLARDYESLFKPCLGALAPGGLIIATNHLFDVSRDQFANTLTRCASKAGRPLHCLDWLEPEADFPSPDGLQPLKIALVRA